MRKNKYVPNIGDTLTIDNTILSISGRIKYEKGDKVKVTHIEMSKGYWSTLCPDIYVKPELRYLMIKGEKTHWLPSAFTETKETKDPKYKESY